MAEDWGLWVSNDPTPDGTYRTTVMLSKDWSQVLTPDAALRWARSFIDAGVRALYDAAVYAQLKKMGLKHNDAGPFIMALRGERPPLVQPMDGLRLEPGVNPKGEPFIGVWLEDEQLMQLDSDQAMLHGQHVLEVITAADYDAGYLRMLKGVVGVEDRVARAAVGGLREQMEKLGGSTPMPKEDE